MNQSQDSKHSKNKSTCMFWPSNLPHYQSSLQNEYFLLGWNVKCEQKPDVSIGTVIVAGIIHRDSYSLNQIQNTLSIWRQQYQQQRIDLVEEFQIIQCSTSTNMHLILYDQCIGLQYYRHVPCNIHDFYEKCDSYKSSTYDSFLIKITEANRILHDILCLLKKNRRQELKLSIYAPLEEEEEEETLNSLPLNCLSYFELSKHRMPLWSLVRLLLFPLSKTKSQTNTTCQTYVTIESLAIAQLSRNQYIYSNSIDLILGALCGIVLIHFHQDLMLRLSNVGTWFNDKVLRDNIAWLEQFPVGFKLNVPLTHVFGKYILAFTSIHEYLLSTLWKYSNTVSVGIGYISIVFGFRSFLALSHDFARISTIHISILANIFQAIFWFQFSLFNSLWHLFRGKKINILRQRSDTLEYDFMQLFLGMILFVTCLFLFTTMLVYYTFFFILDVLMRSIIMIPRLCYIFISIFPFAKVFASLIRPRLLTVQSIIEAYDETKSDDAINGMTNDTTYKIRCKTLGTIPIVVQGCKDVLKRM